VFRSQLRSLVQGRIAEVREVRRGGRGLGQNIPMHTNACEQRWRLCCGFRKRHGTTTARWVRGLIVEEEAALGIGAKSERRPWTLGEKFGSERAIAASKPIEAAFGARRIHAPRHLQESIRRDFGDSKDFVDGLTHSAAIFCFRCMAVRPFRSELKVAGLQEQASGPRADPIGAERGVVPAFGRDNASGLQQLQ